jgi:NADPH:quinone reductase-like Zn-dependent oxidoreductase
MRMLKAFLQTPRFHPLKLMERNIAVIGVSLGSPGTRFGALLRGELEELGRMYEAGKLKPVIAKTFPLDQAAAAHQFIHDRKNIGKVILSVR